ncbi:MAG: HAD-IC family P-type ATPase [Actinobacteria bacterium]|nr:HAD-IC family P-type ATPase [Actinomycetota bacterium]
MPNLHCKKINQVLAELKADVNGLSGKEAEKRIKRSGPNELPAGKPLGKLTIFLAQFKSPLIYILLIAGAISLLLRDYVDASVIFGAVIINTVIGFIQENKANNTLNKLKQLIKHKAYVLRDGHEIKTDSSRLVAGDIIIIRAGNRIPADARLLEADNLLVNESMLTGESVPAMKGVCVQKAGVSIADRKNMIYAGTIAVGGTGKAVVAATGQKTEIGKIASLVEDTEDEETPLQARLAKFSNLLGIIIAAAVLLVAAVGIIQGRPLFDMFIMGVALAVSAIPEGLIVAVTVILVLGMQRILKQKALVRKLVAAETLGSTTVICTDKTGTLTEGKMHVANIIIGEKEFEVGSLGSRQDSIEAKVVSLALQTAMMCNDAVVENPEDALAEWRIAGAPTDAALMSAAVQSGLSKEKLLKIEPRIGGLPFDSNNKFMISLHKKKGGEFVLYEKGAPEKLLDKSSMFYHKGKTRKITAVERKKLNNNYNKLTNKGLRVIGVAIRNFKNPPTPFIKGAFKKSPSPNIRGGVNNAPLIKGVGGIEWEKIDDNLTFIGFIAIKDPLRPEAKETIKICRQAGIRPIIITGDYQLTAKAIAIEVGFKVKSENIITGEAMDKMSDAKLKSQVKKIDVYARVSPHHKLRIVKALQSRGEVVAMTGDGINDSPALKAADIGISLGTGTDIAKEASDIVLLDNNFKTIVASVRQGRTIFANIRKVVIYLISDSFSEVILIIGSIILGMPLAILPAQILWINIVNDGLPDFSLAFEKGAKGVMRQKPIKKQEPILNKEMKIIIFGVGITRDLLVFCLFIYFFYIGTDIAYLRTMFFALLGVKSLSSIFSLRDLNYPVWRLNPFSNLYLVGAALISFSLLLSAIYWHPLQSVLSTVSLDANAWALIVLASVISILMVETVKHHFIIKANRQKA